MGTFLFHRNETNHDTGTKLIAQPGIVPAEVFDTRTRAKGVSIGVMVSFAFNTMIGQVTPIAMSRIGWRFYLLFVICNFTNALYFWAFQPETKKRPLEEMNYLFTNAPYVEHVCYNNEMMVLLTRLLHRLFVPTMNMKDFEIDLEHRVERIEEKDNVARHESVTGQQMQAGNL